jgi:hypothetical protein
VVTATSTTPDPTGATAVIDVSELTVKLEALVEPNVTAVTLLNPPPVIVTDVPPVAGPALGSTLVTVGAGDAVVAALWTVLSGDAKADGAATAVTQAMATRRAASPVL